MAVYTDNGNLIFPLLLKKVYLFYLMCLSILSICIQCIDTNGMTGACENQKRALSPLKLELQMVISHYERSSENLKFS